MTLRYVAPGALAMLLGLSACTDAFDPAQRAIGGAMFGAGAGAAIGAATGFHGAALGAVAGAAVGAITGIATLPTPVPGVTALAPLDRGPYAPPPPPPPPMPPVPIAPPPAH
jgi:hypothetical protein